VKTMGDRPDAPEGAKSASIRNRTPSKWWESFFGEDYVLMYGSALTPELSAQQVEFACRELSLRRGSLLLDLCCGFGRHLRWFLARGIRAYGVERSACQIAKARRPEQARILRGDARALPFDAGFDGVVCMYTSFGYFDDAGNRRQATESFRALKPGGRLLIDNQNPGAYLSRLQPVRRVQDGMTTTTVTEEFEYDGKTRRLYSRKEVATPTRAREYFFSLQTYTSEELAQLLEETGFVIESTCGDYEGSPYSDSSPRLILVARKPRSGLI